MGASSADTAYEKILDMISTREIKSGDKINESTIANRFGMSRTPVREAIRRLQQDGLVEVRKNQGSFLRKYSYAEMADGYEITAMLTQMACRHLAEKYDQIDESDNRISSTSSMRWMTVQRTKRSGSGSSSTATSTTS